MSTVDISKLRTAAAHLLALAVTSLYKDAKLGTFGITDHGFYYDIEFDEPISSDELPAIQAKMLEIVLENVKFSQENRSYDSVVKEFTSKEQPYKRELLDEVGSRKVEITIIGGNDGFIDLAAGPVVESTSQLEHLWLLDVSGAYWKGDDKRSMLTRISGACFASEKELEAFREYRAELLRRDHRVMGKKLGFYSVDPEVGTGLIFWSPRGRFVRDALAGIIKQRVLRLGAELVETPVLANAEKTILITQPQSEQVIAKSTHEDTERWYAVRQQVVGAHVRMFSWKERSYRDLPWKVGEIAKVVRYEKSGELEGLHRSREITQDTTTIVCTLEQLEKELELLITTIVAFVRDLGFTDFELVYRLPVATTKQQKQILAEIETNVKSISKKLAISITFEAAEHRVIAEPELVMRVTDSLKQKREWSKIQLLMSLPIEQQIEFMGSDGEVHNPVVIRATIAGSLERVIATMIEHYAGVLPLWLTYEHARVIPVTSKQELYAEKVARQLLERGIRATIDSDAEPLEGKIKQAEEEKVPYMLIVGEKEQTTNGISVRVQGHGDIGLLDIETFIRDIQGEISSKSIKSALI